MSKDLKASLRKALTDAAKSADYASPRLQAQASAVNHAGVRADADRFAMRAAIVSRADEVMRSGMHPHPLDAFFHSVECNYPELSDDEFFAILQGWSEIIGRNGGARFNEMLPKL